MRKNLKLITILLTFCLVFTLVAGCNDSSKKVEPTPKPTNDTVKKDPTPEPKKLKEITAWGVIDPQISAQQIIADKMGFFEEEGLKVTNKLQQSGTEIGPMMAGGSAQVTFESTYTDISLATNNIPITLIAPIANIGGTQAVVAKSGFEINSAKDLEGAKIGMAPGSGVLIAIRKMCDELGVDLDSFTFVALQPADQVAALEKGDIDMMACWEPWVSKGMALGGELLFSGLKSYLPENEGDVNYLNFHTTLQVTNDMLDDTETLKSLLKALVKATDYINENKEEAAEILSTELNIEKDELIEIMGRNVYSLKVDQGFIDGVTEMSAFMKEMGNIQETPELSSFIDFSILSEVDKSLVEVDVK